MPTGQGTPQWVVNLIAKSVLKTGSQIGLSGSPASVMLSFQQIAGGVRMDRTFTRR